MKIIVALLTLFFVSLGLSHAQQSQLDVWSQPSIWDKGHLNVNIVAGGGVQDGTYQVFLMAKLNNGGWSGAGARQVTVTNGSVVNGGVMEFVVIDPVYDMQVASGGRLYFKVSHVTRTNEPNITETVSSATVDFLRIDHPTGNGGVVQEQLPLTIVINNPTMSRSITFKLTLTDTCTEPHSIQFVNPKGGYIEIGTFTGGPNVTQNISFTTSIPEGPGTYGWAVNGTSIVSGSYGVEIVGSEITDLATFSCSPTPTPTPSPSPTPTPTPSPTPDPSTTPPPAPQPSPNPSAPPSNYIGTQTQDDMYQAVRKALRDSGDEFKASGIGISPVEEINTTERGELDNLRTKTEEIATGVESTKTKLTEKIQARSQISLPTGFGTVSGYNIGTVAGYNCNLNWSAYSGLIAGMRSVILFLEWIGFFFMILVVFRYYLA